MFLKISNGAKANLIMFLVSVVALVHYSHDMFLSMIVVELTALYVMLMNRRQREILPALMIVVVGKILTLPLITELYSPVSVKDYILVVLCYDLLMAVALHAGYKSEALRKLFNVSTPARKIPQVLAMCTLLYLGVVHLCLVLGEVLIWQYDHTLLSSTPFFYGSFELVRTLHKMLLLLAIWSMCLDSYFVDYERYRRLTGVVKTN